MRRKWTTYNVRCNLKMLNYLVVLTLIFGVSGCAILQEAPLIEIPASRLSCLQNPEMVDGDLKTVGAFKAKGTVRKGFGVIPRNPRQYQRVENPRYQRQVIGSLKTETLIKLDVPTYVKYVDIYPASTIPNFALDITDKEISSKWLLSFTPVKDKRGKKVKGTLPVRFQIGQKILYLRLTANAQEDLDKVSHSSRYGEMKVSLKGAAIREVKF